VVGTGVDPVTSHFQIGSGLMSEGLAVDGLCTDFLVRGGNPSTQSLSLHLVIARRFALTRARQGHGT